MKSQPSNVLVTGAGGFLGIHLVRQLLSNGYRGSVSAFDNFTTGSRARLEAFAGPRLEVVTGDIRQRNDFDQLAEKAEIVFHLAAISDPRRCEEDHDLAQTVNVDGTREVVAAAKGRRLVFLSTAAVYGSQGEEPITEQSPLLGTGVYADSKREGEQIVSEAVEQGLLEAVVVRNFNSYGGGQADGFLVPKLVKQGLEGRIEIWNCQPVRDFTYAEDSVRALASLAFNPEAHGVFNLGSGRRTRVGDLATEVGRILDAPVSCLNKPVGGAACLLASVEKVKKAAGWEPQIDLRDGILRTIDWYRENAVPESASASPSRPGKQAA